MPRRTHRVGRWNEKLRPLLVSISELRPHPRNPRVHSEENLAQVRASYEANGQQKPIVTTRDGVVLAGNGQLAAATALGWTHIARVTYDGDDPDRFVLEDNRTGETSEWGVDELPEFVDGWAAGGGDLAALPWPEAELADLVADWRQRREPQPTRDPDAIPEKAPARTKPGDLWLLGDHRLLCGDATSDDAIRLLRGSTDDPVPLLLTDPPYCSGSNQEAGKSAGTWGDIASDNLSTRGYVALMRAAFNISRPQVVYCFTDWRMWITLFDVVEAAGVPSRGMIVWNKETPGLGSTWRTQHELVLFGSRSSSKRTKGKPAFANVISCKRSGNHHHYTEKPVELLVTLLNGDRCVREAVDVYDPFAGSGSTIIAAEQVRRRCDAMEVEPRICDVAVARWETFTGRKAERVRGRHPRKSAAVK